MTHKLAHTSHTYEHILFHQILMLSKKCDLGHLERVSVWQWANSCHNLVHTKTIFKDNWIG